MVAIAGVLGYKYDIQNFNYLSRSKSVSISSLASPYQTDLL
jgi:hypothetical protein